MREYLLIHGGRRLAGSVSVAGAKNAALPLLKASLLTAEECVITNVPNLEDISVSLQLLRAFGAEAEMHGHEVRIRARRIERTDAPFHLVKMLRSSFWAFGPLVARAGSCRMPLPGGDAIGSRPVDIHLRGIAALGADIRIENGVVIGHAPGGLSPADITCEFPSVGATHHILMTAALVPGETIVRNAAREPEVVELAAFLRSMGAEVEGEGTPTVAIRGREDLGGGKLNIIGDRIEATTYLSLAAVTQGSITVRGLSPDAMSGTLSVFREAGCDILTADHTVTLSCSRRLKATSFETAPFPGVATDVQPLLMAVMASAEGRAEIRESIFENRFGHVHEYRKCGADISVRGRVADVKGVTCLTGAAVEAGDIRAAAGLVVLGACASGETTVYDIHHLDRGYELLVEKFRSLGGEIQRVPAFDSKEVVFGC